MKKKFTMLLASLFACVGVMKAEVTDLPEMSTGKDIKWYTIKNVRQSKYATYAGDAATMTQQATASAASLFYFSASKTDGAVKIHNYAAGEKLCAKYNSWTATGIDWYLAAQSTGVSICTSDGEWDAWNDAGGFGQKVEYWSASDPGSAWAIELVTDFTSVIDVPAAKEAAVAELDNLAKISAIYPDATQAKADVNAVVATGTSLDELNAAIEAIDAVVVAYKKQADGKSVKFSNHGSGVREGRHLGYDKGNSRAAAVAASGDEAIWTLKACKDGTFKMYNFVYNLYLGAPADAATHANEADAPSFKLISTDANKGALVCSNGNMVHVANHTNYKLMSYYDLNDGASLWTITVSGDVVVSREQYDAAAAAKEALPYAIQQAFGLVTDAANYVSNYLSTAEGSYEALLDNTVSTYFHSSYAAEDVAEGIPAHYIQANLGEGNSVDEFYFYMAPRQSNGNNRPVNVTVAGSNDNETYTTIKEITTTLDGSMTPYVSEKLGTAGTKYQYIRLTVTTTNTSTKFFTLSELYFFPATAGVASLIESYNAFATSSITSEAMSTAADALINAETTLALINIKEEIAVLLSANENNHAATPALGQYTTEAYNALNAAYTAEDATLESLEAAIAAFKATLNMPVYLITSAFDNGYSAGSAILYNGSWIWATANKYNKEMWMTIPGYTEGNVPAVAAYDAEGTSYEICDYLTGHVMRDKKVQIVKIAGWTGAYNLQYSTNQYDAVHHAAQTNKALVGWNPSSVNDEGVKDCQASAWRIEYLGSTYDLSKLTDEQLTALTDLQSTYNANKHLNDITLSDKPGEYSGSKDDIEGALAAAAVIFKRSLAKLANYDASYFVDVKDAIIDAAKSLKINLPVAGKYYRFSYDFGEAGVKYVQAVASGVPSKANGMVMTEEKGAASIFYFDGSKLLSYSAGLYVKDQGGDRGLQTVGDENAGAAKFEAGSVVGKLYIYAGDSFHANKSDNIYFVDHCGTPHANEHNFTVEEVTTLPVTIGEAGYATFYAPVAVTLPAEVKANTLEDKGSYATLNEENITVIPAKNGVILTGAAGTYDFAISTEDGENLENALEGTVAKTLIEKNANDAYYMLAIKEDVAGLYNPVKGEDATKFYNAGHKAYWHLEGATQSATYRIGEESTGIDQLINANGELVIYDLAGRRVEKMEKGIYIVNGKKVIK